MRNFANATIIAGLWCMVMGCGEGDAPSPTVVQNKSAESDTVAGTTKAVEAASEAPPVLDLAEPTVPNNTPADEPGPASELKIGDAAPPISIAKWVKGDPVAAFSGDKVFVVEFWATWCGPCLAGMPHIASLQTEYGDKVQFIGVSAEEEEVVTEFMGQDSGSGKLWSEVLTYTIALDEERKTNAAYMQAAGQNGIPCAFVVGKSGKVEWIGHPAGIDEPLKKVVDGTWDFVAEREAQEMLQEIGPKISAALQKDDFKTGVALIDQLIAKSPGNSQFKQARFQFLLKDEMFDEANKAAEELIKASNDNAMELNQLAWVLSTSVPGPGPDLDLALAAAKRAEELTESKNASILDTLGRVLFAKGNIDDAIVIQKKAIELANLDEKEQLEASLKEYEAARDKGNAADAKPAETGEAKPAETGEEKPADAGEEKPAEPDAAKPAEDNDAKPADDAPKN
ncbi:MAG: redoxin family protein [Fuerstia sp.]|nr:redoxin family protein [Fuerstiella sp.]